MRALVLGLAFALGVTSAFAQVRNVGRGDPDRKRIIDTVRAPMQREVGGRVIYYDVAIREADGWVFFRGEPKRPGGRYIEPKGTFYEADADFMDGWTNYVLLRRSGSRWQIVERHIAPTDISYCGWRKTYDLARGLSEFDSCGPGGD